MTPHRFRQKMMRNALRKSQDRKNDNNIICSNQIKRKHTIFDEENDIIAESPQVVFERKKFKQSNSAKTLNTRARKNPELLEESVICLFDDNKKIETNDESVIIIDDTDKANQSAKEELAIVYEKCEKSQPTTNCKFFFEDRTPALEYVSLINKPQPKKRKVFKKPKRKPVPKQVPKPVPPSVSNQTDSEPEPNADEKTGELREIIVDGCNIARAFNKQKKFDERGIEIVVNYFQKRGHTVTVFVPQHKRSQARPLLEQYHKEGIVVFTASRRVGGKTIASYDDRYILEYATMKKGIVVSLDQFRDLYEEKPEWRDTISKRILQPTFARGMVMFPEDPLGRKGPTLHDFLRH